MSSPGLGNRWVLPHSITAKTGSTSTQFTGLRKFCYINQEIVPLWSFAITKYKLSHSQRRLGNRLQITTSIITANYCIHHRERRKSKSCVPLPVKWNRAGSRGGEKFRWLALTQRAESDRTACPATGRPMKYCTGSAGSPLLKHKWKRAIICKKSHIMGTRNQKSDKKKFATVTEKVKSRGTVKVWVQTETSIGFSISQLRCRAYRRRQKKGILTYKGIAQIMFM